MVTMLIGTHKSSASFKTTIRDFSLMLNSVVEDNFDIRKNVKILAEYMDINECDACLFLEQTKRTQKLWLTDSKVTFKFNILNLQSIYDLSFPVNYHKKLGHILVFSDEFDSIESLKGLKECFSKVFEPIVGAPFERIIGFFFENDKIHIRNYLINDITEIGPRIDLELERTFEGCFIVTKALSNE